MRVVTVTPILVEVPLKRAVQVCMERPAGSAACFVRVTTGRRRQGGNVDSDPGYSLVSAIDIHDAVARLTPALIGADPFNLHRALALMDRGIAEGFEAKGRRRDGAPHVKGRALGLPVHFNCSAAP